MTPAELERRWFPPCGFCVHGSGKTGCPAVGYCLRPEKRREALSRPVPPSEPLPAALAARAVGVAQMDAERVGTAS